MAPYCAPPAEVGVPDGLIALSRGRYAPGHLGELGTLLPPELVDAALEEHGGRHSRLRDLPSRCGVYFILAMCLFPEVGYSLVWRKLTAALGPFPMVNPTAKALRDLRRRIGVTPMRALYETVAGPLQFLASLCYCRIWPQPPVVVPDLDTLSCSDMNSTEYAYFVLSSLIVS